MTTPPPLSLNLYDFDVNLPETIFTSELSRIMKFTVLDFPE